MTLPDYVTLEMKMAEIMSRQEESGFRFDMSAAEHVRSELAEEAKALENTITSRFTYVPGKKHTALFLGSLQPGTGGPRSVARHRRTLAGMDARSMRGTRSIHTVGASQILSDEG